MQRIFILGTWYTVAYVDKADDKYLDNCDGYCDSTSKRIVIANKDVTCNVDKFSVHQKKVLRHEVIHAFLNESELQECYEHPRYGHEETMVDWFAIQMPKIVSALKELKAL